MASPLFKWPGGKRGLASKILRCFPGTYGRYYEPFAGGAAMFFALGPESAVLGDVNSEVMNAFAVLKHNRKRVRSELWKLENTSEEYYRVRESVPTNDVERAVRFLYLRSLSFNGIYRISLSGRFNVPYGGKDHVVPNDYIEDDAKIDLLNRADIRFGDFEETTCDVKRGDLVYFDPPYTLAHNNNGFIKYNEKLFSWHDQVRLAEYACHLRSMGVHVIVSNADHEAVNLLYSDFDHLKIGRYSRIAADINKREAITESLYVSIAND